MESKKSVAAFDTLNKTEKIDKDIIEDEQNNIKNEQENNRPHNIEEEDENCHRFPETVSGGKNIVEEKSMELKESSVIKADITDRKEGVYVEDEVKDDTNKVEEERDTGELESRPSELLGEEEVVPEEVPPDPTAPFNLSDSKEALKLPFQLQPDQVKEVEMLWEMFQDHTPAYANLDGFITPKELVYMLKALLLMTQTPEQMYELIEFCVRPPHPENHINYEQFLKIVTMRQRDFILEEQIRQALQVFDPQHSGIVNREEIRNAMTNLGLKLSSKIVDNFIKEVDITGDGELSIEDIVGTMCIDLNEEDLQMLRDQVHPPPVKEEPDVDIL